MKAIWAKTNIFILTVAGLAVAVYIALYWSDLPAARRALGFFVIAIVLHEWEEMRFPGGFYELMTKKFGLTGYTEEQAGMAHGVVVLAIAVFSFVPFLFWEQLPWLAGMPAILGIFEAIIHVVGIKIHKLPRPYSPGMATALVCLLPASICIIVYGMADVSGTQWLFALLCYLLVFAAMELGVWRSFGVSPKELPAKMRAIAHSVRRGE